ncbi:prophage tail fiber N-terminal domain-containing protein, partial [Serratia nevei]|uniref:prophage tail fiber N-terminal domain-containing protein n=1 Tax=Serratia nevei TaxID=2703794 RepID=UPI003F7E1E42
MIKISGVYRDPAGVAMPGALIAVKSKNNTLETFKCLCVETVTGLGGEYEFSVVPDDYEVFITYGNGIRQRLGFMRIEDGAADGSLNDYLIYADPELARPPVYSDIKRMSERAKESALTAAESEKRAESARDGALDAKDVALREASKAVEAADAASLSKKESKENSEKAFHAAIEAEESADKAEAYARIAQSGTDAYPDVAAAQAAID